MVQEVLEDLVQGQVTRSVAVVILAALVRSLEEEVLGVLG